jgi:DNA polymerase I
LCGAVVLADGYLMWRHLRLELLEPTAYSPDFDFHKITAAMCGIERKAAKTVNFGILYGQGAQALAKSLGVDRAVAQGYIDTIFENAPGLEAWYAEQVKRAEAGERYAVTKTGRRR